MTAVRFEAGAELAGETVPVTALLVSGGALLGRDYYPVHHDPDFARGAGVDGAFLNVMTTTGLVGAYVARQFDVDDDLSAISLRLGAPCPSGSSLRFTGTVTATGETVAGHWCDVAVRADVVNGRNHVTATVRVSR